MGYYRIRGGHGLNGSLTVQGAKNSVLPILAATLLVGGTYTIRNCPDISDVDAALEILEYLGCRVEKNANGVEINTNTVDRSDIPDRLMRKMRSSVIFLGALLARRGEAKISLPGGCELGPRPIDLHMTALRKLGAHIEEREGYLWCDAEDGLHGQDICLMTPSVGATENAMLCACGCNGTTVIRGAAREPEIEDLGCFLQKMGAEISGLGTSQICVRGSTELHGTDYVVLGDRIAAATYLCAVAATGGTLHISGICPEYAGGVTEALTRAGCDISFGEKEITLRSGGLLRGIGPVRTAPYPGFPTDAQAILMAALAGGTGSTMFVENMFESRYGHVDELRRLGADIQVSDRVAVVTGAGKLRGARVYGTDLRGTAALVVAALAAKGTTYVFGLNHIRRGYQHLPEELQKLGADIQEIQE